MHPNYAQDKPPCALTLGGVSVDIQTDYRVWIEVMRLMRALNLRPTTEASAKRTLEGIETIERLVFGRVLKDVKAGEVLAALVEFSKGYPMAPIRSRSNPNGPAYSFEYDLNAIIIAIRNQSGIDLSYRCKYFHWWEFLLEFHTLCGDHYILNLMEARSYNGTDKERRRRRDDCALPPEYTQEEMEEYEALDALFQ